MGELDKLIGCFYIGKFDKEADCHLQDSERMGLKAAMGLVDHKRSTNPKEEYTILGVVDY